MLSGAYSVSKIKKAGKQNVRTNLPVESDNDLSNRIAQWVGAGRRMI